MHRSTLALLVVYVLEGLVRNSFSENAKNNGAIVLFDNKPTGKELPIERH